MRKIDVFWMAAALLFGSTAALTARADMIASPEQSEETVLTTADAVVIGNFTGAVRTVVERGTATGRDGTPVDVEYTSEYHEFRIQQVISGSTVLKASLGEEARANLSEATLPTLIELQVRTVGPGKDPAEGWRRPAINMKVGLALAVLPHASGTRYVILGARNLVGEDLNDIVAKARKYGRKTRAEASRP